MPDGSPDKKLPAVIPSPEASLQGVTIDGLLASIESDKVVNYLLDSRSAVKLAEWIVGELSLPENIAKPLVRLALKFLAKLLLSRTAQGGSWISQKVLDATIYSLKHLTHSQIILHAISKMLQRLNKDALAKAEMDALLLGATTVISAEAAASFSDDTQLALKQLGEIAEIKTDIAGLATYMEGRLNPQPPLSLPLLDDTAQNRLRFAARHIPFLGREGEMAQLNAFRDGVEQFSWGLVTGSGGLGKSRLALEFCLTAGTAWRVGFLSDRSTFTSWETWQPDQPTLIVVDYVAMRAELIGDMLGQLNSRNDLECPVRVLLLERQKDEVWWKQMVPNTSEGLALAQSQFDTDDFLAISKLKRDALWEIITTIVDADMVDALDKQEVLEKLCEIDPEQRPLYAALVADALKAGRTLGGWDKERLFNDVIDREEKNYWLSAIPAGTNGAPALLESHKNLLAFMTMIGGLPLDQIDKLPESLELPKTKDLCRSLYQAMSGTQFTGLSLTERENVELHGLTPDPLGEFFTLSHLESRGVKTIEKFRWSAWSIESPQSFSFGVFLERCNSDFVDHECLAYLIDQRPPTSHGRYAWVRLQSLRATGHAVVGELVAAAKLVETLAQLTTDYPEEPILRAVWANSVAHMIVGYSGAGDMSAAAKILSALEKVTFVYSDEPTLREQWVISNAIMILDYCVVGDLSAAAVLLIALEKLIHVLPDDPFLREYWAQSVFVMTNYYRKIENLSAASKLLDALWKVIHAHADEPILRKYWAESVSYISFYYGGVGNLKAVTELYTALEEMAVENSDDLVLREQWARTAFIMIYAYANAGNLNVASKVLTNLEAVSHAHSNEPILREQWSAAAFHMIDAHSHKGRLHLASALLKALEQLIFKYSDEPILRENWGRAAVNLTSIYHKKGDVNAAAKLLSALERVSHANPDEYALRESWGRSACIMVLSYVERGHLTQANDLVDALEEVAKKYLDEPRLQELWVKMDAFRRDGYKDTDS